MRLRKATFLILAILLTALFSNISFSASNEISVKVPTFKVVVNGVKIDNIKSKYPLLVYKDITYFPMTYNYANALGLKTEWNQATGFGVSKNNSTSNIQIVQDLTGNNSTGTSYKAIIPTFKVKVNGKEINNQTEQYPCPYLSRFSER